jgi:hypothetical protein
VKVASAAEAREESQKRTQEAKAAERENRKKAEVEAVKEDIRKAFNSVPDTLTNIQNRAGHKRRAFDAAWAEMLRAGEVTETEITKGNNRKYPGFKRVYES